MLDIGSIVGALLKPALALLEWLLKKLKRTDAGRHLPGQTLRVVPDAARFFIWGDGMRGNTPVMSVRGSFYLTNITSRSDIVITRTFVQVFQWTGFRPSRERFDGFAILAPPGNSLTGPWSSKYMIPAGETREAKGDWMIEPPIRSKGKPLRGRAYFVDQLGNEHRAKAVHTFRYMG